MMRIGTYFRNRPALAAGLLAGGVLASLLISGLGVAQDAGRPVFAGTPSFADVFEQVNPAVVTVEVNSEPVVMPTAGRSPYQGNPFQGTPFEDFFGFQFPDIGPMTETPLRRG